MSNQLMTLRKTQWINFNFFKITKQKGEFFTQYFPQYKGREDEIKIITDKYI